jgi:hypothetical protein
LTLKKKKLGMNNRARVQQMPVERKKLVQVQIRWGQIKKNKEENLSCFAMGQNVENYEFYKVEYH